MKHTQLKRQRGAALIIGLILLAIITLLAVVGMNMSNSELASATSEQVRLRAFQAAEGGIENGLVEMRTLGTTATEEKGVKFAAVGAPSSPKDSSNNPIDTYTNTIAFRGVSSVPGYSGKSFAAFHYSVLSDGASARNAVVHHETGAYLVGPYGGSDTFGALPE